MQLDKFPILDAMTRKLHKRGCFVGWNPTTENWDLKVGRGALAESRVRAVVEHHGGPRRTAKVSALVRPPRLIGSILVLMVGLAAFAAWMGKVWLASAVLLLLSLVWLAAIVEANRLESVLLAAADETASDLMVSNASSTPQPNAPEPLQEAIIQG
jgi:hypothetical protein